MEIEFLRNICSQLPGTTEDIKWDNDLCFSVAAKMYCVTSLDPPFKVAFKVPDEDFEEVSSREGIIPAPYMARAKWVQVIEPERLNKNDWERFIQTSYNLVKQKLPKSTIAVLDLNAVGQARLSPNTGKKKAAKNAPQKKSKKKIVNSPRKSSIRSRKKG